MNLFQHDRPVRSHEHRPAVEADLPYLRALAKRHTNELGFISDEALRWYTNDGSVSLGLENGEPAGFLLYKRHSPTYADICPIYQAAVQMDARRQSLGILLVNTLAERATIAGRGLLQLWCRDDLAANEFWFAAGFEAAALRQGGSQRAGVHILWRRKLSANADIKSPVSSRRRGKAGVPVLLPSDISSAQIIESCGTSTMQKLLTRLSHSAWPSCVCSGSSTEPGLFDGCDVAR